MAPVEYLAVGWETGAALHNLPFPRNHPVCQVGFEIIHHLRAVGSLKKRLTAP